jgi:hypothetical protein
MLNTLKAIFIVGVLIVALTFLIVKAVTTLVAFLINSTPQNPTPSL